MGARSALSAGVFLIRRDLNEAFETAEYARLASCLISPAEAAGEGADWAFEDLGAVDRWFAELRPVLPVTMR